MSAWRKIKINGIFIRRGFMEKYIIDFASMAWEKPTPGVLEKAVVQSGKKLRLVEFTKDFVEPDWCRKGHFGYVLEGELEIDFNGISIKAKKGDGIMIPAEEKAKHKAKILSPSAKLVLVEDL